MFGAYRRPRTRGLRPCRRVPRRRPVLAQERLAIEYAERFALDHTNIDDAFIDRCASSSTTARSSTSRSALRRSSVWAALNVLGIEETCLVDVYAPSEVRANSQLARRRPPSEVGDRAERGRLRGPGWSASQHGAGHGPLSATSTTSPRGVVTMPASWAQFRRSPVLWAIGVPGETDGQPVVDLLPLRATSAAAVRPHRRAEQRAVVDAPKYRRRRPRSSSAGCQRCRHVAVPCSRWSTDPPPRRRSPATPQALSDITIIASMQAPTVRCMVSPAGASLSSVPSSMRRSSSPRRTACRGSHSVRPARRGDRLRRRWRRR